MYKYPSQTTIVFPELTQCEKYRQNAEAQEPFPIKITGEFT